MAMYRCKSSMVAVLGFLFVTLGAASLSALAPPDGVKRRDAAPRREIAELTVAEFAKLHKELAFAKTGFWSIPWHVSLSEARAQAAREKKPVFLSLGSGTVLATC